MGNGMTARAFAPVGALEVEPLGAYTEQAEREEALRDALRDVELGRYDDRAVEWMARRLDNSMLRVVVSWLERVCGAGMVNVLDVEAALQKRRPDTGLQKRRPDTGRLSG
jgi:hypothetical protein